jgi:hypothetical protein
MRCTVVSQSYGCGGELLLLGSLDCPALVFSSFVVLKGREGGVPLTVVRSYVTSS